MNKLSAAFLALMISAAISSDLPAQGTLYMHVESVPGDQPRPHEGEFRLNSYAAAATNSVTVGGTGLTSGKASFVPAKAWMKLSPASSASFHRAVATGSRLPFIEVRFYNSSGQMYYKTVYEDVFISGVSTEAAADDVVQQLEFIGTRIKWFASPDASRAPTQAGCWDVAANRSC